MKIRNVVGFILLFSFVVLINCKKEAPDYVALINEKYEISISELVENHKDGYFGVRFSDSEYKGFEEALDELVLNKLKQVDFIARNLDEDKELTSQIQRVINEELLVLYFDQEYLGKYINDEVVQDFYEGLGKEVYYQQIVLRKNNENKEEVRAKATEIKEIAETTGDFEALVRQFSQHPSSVPLGGKMPPLNWKESLKSRSGQIVFRIPKGAIRIVETLNSFMIVKVYDVKEHDIVPLEEIEPEVRKQLRELYVEQALRDYDYDKSQMIDDADFNWNEENLERIVEWSRIDGFYDEDKYKEIIQNELESGNNFVIVTHGANVVDLRKFRYLLDDILLLKVSPTNVYADNVKEYLDEALRSEIVVNNAKELGLQKNIISMDSPSDVILSEMVYLYNQRFIFSRIPEYTAENIQNFYELTKDSLFYQYDKVNTRVKIFDNQEEAQATYKQIESGKELGELFHELLVKSFYINKQGAIDSYMSNEPPYLGDAAFKLKEGEVSSPVEFVDENGVTKFAIIKATNVDEQKILSPSEILPARLERMFRNYYYEKLSEEVSKELKAKYPLWINYEILEGLAANYKGR